MRVLSGIAVILAVTTGYVCGAEGDRPNILWLSAEDMSPHLGCYRDAEAKTPNLDRFARGAVRFDQAFATAPVCSPARSCLITGMYATSLGTQRLRSQFPIPADFGPFPALLRTAGYYCSNNVKTDYNVRDEASMVRAAWDESSANAHWRGRRAGQPFFSVFNFMTTHQSRTSVWPQDQFESEIGSQLTASERHDPDQLSLPPYYPNTALARQAWARYRDCITLMDKQAGSILDELAADGLAENTIVFFFSDHGMGMPRGKRCLYDSGMHVPLLVRFPEKWSHLAPGAPGSTSTQLVSFVDFPPTVLRLCSIMPPTHYQGEAFLANPSASPREYVHGARDRVDEAFDVARSVRDDRWLYIRNFMPHLPWLQPEGFSDGAPFRREWLRLAAAGQLAPAAQAAVSRRPVEELYDTRQDPHQLRNLAMEIEHQPTLERLRKELRRWQLATRDAGYLAESQMWQRVDGGRTPWHLAQEDGLYPLSRLLEAADLVGSEDAQRQREWLQDSNAGVRHWAAVGLHARPNLAAADRQALAGAMRDGDPVVRVEAAAALARHGDAPQAIPALVAALHDDSRPVVLHAVRALELLGAASEAAHPELAALLPKMQQAEATGDDLAMFIRFSIEAALKP